MKRLMRKGENNPTHQLMVNAGGFVDFYLYTFLHTFHAFYKNVNEKKKKLTKINRNRIVACCNHSFWVVHIFIKYYLTLVFKQ